MLTGAFRPLPLLLTHGWPSTFYEFWPVISRLADPGGHGGDRADAFDVVVPSLPGFGFSAALSGAGDATRIPRLWHRLMTKVLHYRRYGAHGGDIGAMATNRLAVEYPEALAGIHVTMPAEPHADVRRESPLPARTPGHRGPATDEPD